MPVSPLSGSVVDWLNQLATVPVEWLNQLTSANSLIVRAQHNSVMCA